MSVCPDTDETEESSIEGSVDAIMDKEFDDKFVTAMETLKNGQKADIQRLKNYIFEEESVGSDQDDPKNCRISKPIFLKDYEIDLILNKKRKCNDEELNAICTKDSLRNYEKNQDELKIISALKQKTQDVTSDDIFVEKTARENSIISHDIPENIFSQNDEKTQFIKRYLMGKEYLFSDKKTDFSENKKEDEEPKLGTSTKMNVSYPRKIASSRLSERHRSLKNKQRQKNKIVQKKKILEDIKLAKKCQNESQAVHPELGNSEMFTDDQNEDFSYVESFDCDIPKNSKRKQKKLMRLEKSKKKYMEKHGQIVNHSDPIDETCEYEDVIDDLPVRYNYRKVAPNSYGLTPEQILLCDDKELNKWCSIKKVIGYNDEEEEQKMENIYKRRIKHPQLRKRILPSLFSNTCDLYDTSSQNKKSKRSPRKTPISTNRIRLIKKYFNQADLNKVEKLSTDRLLAYNLKNDSKYSLLRKSSKKKDIS